MKTYEDFINEITLSEETLIFSYNDGGEEQYVVIKGTPSEINKVKKKLPFGTKFVEDAPKDAWEISASDWLKIK